jgi:hypothetical protein
MTCRAMAVSLLAIAQLAGMLGQALGRATFLADRGQADAATHLAAGQDLLTAEPAPARGRAPSFSFSMTR